MTAQVVAILVALAGGNKLSLRLDARKRQTELDLQALSSFYELYGQFFVHLERWNTLRAGVLTESRDHQRNVERRVRGEARMEALLIKIAAEQPLDARDRDLLGSFRQAYQQVREAIRDDRDCAGTARIIRITSHTSHLPLLARVSIARRWNAKADQAVGMTVQALLNITETKYEGNWAQQGLRLSGRDIGSIRPE